MPSTRAAPGSSSSAGCREAGTVWVLMTGPLSPPRSLPSGWTTVSPTVESNSAVKLRWRVSENIRIPVTNATPSTMAKVLSSSRIRRASRLLRDARIMGSASQPGHGVEDLLPRGPAELVDDAPVAQEQHPVAPGRRHRVVSHHHHGLAVVVDAA